MQNINFDSPIYKCMNNNCEVVFTPEQMPFHIRECSDACIFCRECLQANYNKVIAFPNQI